MTSGAKLAIRKIRKFPRFSRRFPRFSRRFPCISVFDFSTKSAKSSAYNSFGIISLNSVGTHNFVHPRAYRIASPTCKSSSGSPSGIQANISAKESWSSASRNFSRACKLLPFSGVLPRVSDTVTRLFCQQLRPFSVTNLSWSYTLPPPTKQTLADRQRACGRTGFVRTNSDMRRTTAEAKRGVYSLDTAFLLGSPEKLP